MLLDRLEFLKAVGFVKPAMVEDTDTAFNCLHVKVYDDQCYLYAGNGNLSKKAHIVRPITTEEAADMGVKDTKETFLIPFSAMHSFEQLVKKHKKKAKKLSKNDASYLYIEISKDNLESFGMDVVYKQPSHDPVNFEDDFNIQRSVAEDAIILNPKETANAMKGFDGSKPVEVTTTGEGSPIHFHQKSTSFEAVLQQTEPEEEE